MVIEKIVLRVGKKKIELTQSEYEELKQHFTDTQWVPYPYPVYPVYPDPNPMFPNTPTYPIITWGDSTVTA